MTTVVPARALTTIAPYSFSELLEKEQPISPNSPSFIEGYAQKDRLRSSSPAGDSGDARLQQLGLFQERQPSLPDSSEFRQILLGDWIGRR